MKIILFSTPFDAPTTRDLDKIKKADDISGCVATCMTKGPLRRIS